MDRSLLDEYSATAAQAIFAAYPDWEAHASAQDGALVVEVPCPVAGHPELRIHTDDEEITVAYDRWHAHFDQWFETDEEHIFADAYACVRAILSEKIAVAVHMSGDRWAGSQILYAGDPTPQPGPGQTTYIRSWLGNYDAEAHHPGT